MKERPILFTGEMVRAILEGRKTQTRRLFKPGSEILYRPQTAVYPVSFRHHRTSLWHDFKSVDELIAKFCPYGKPGDRLWVRETFALETNFNLASNDDYPPPFKDGRPVAWHPESADGAWPAYWQQPHYKATDPIPELDYPDKDTDGPTVRWTPSIHMPRWASRILLEITDVRVERLQEASYEDIMAEGIRDVHWLTAWKNAWNSINAKRGFGWDANPWVWVVEFKVVLPHG